MTLWSRRLLIVTGKGGVGKTTLSVALAMAASRQGKRTCVVELDGQNRAARLCGLRSASYAPRTVLAGVDLMSLTPMECLQDFSQQKLRSKTVVRVLTKNRMFQAFIDAVPGMHDLFQLGKIRNMVADVASERHKYDLVIVDAPSTGHAQTFLASAETIGEMTRNGIIEDEARTISDFLKNPDHTSLVLVTQPDAMPVNETLEFARALQPTTPQIGAIILNRSVAYPLASVPPWSAVKPMLLEQQRHALVRLGDRVQHRQHQAAAARSRIRHGISPTRHPSMTVMDIPDHGPGLSLGHLPDLATAFIAQSSSAS